MESFIILSIIAGIGISLTTGILGCFVVWRKMAYFGDSLAHSALLGIALGLAFNISGNIGVIIAASLFAVLLTYLQNKNILATDTLLGILAHGSLASALVIISLLKKVNFDLESFLFGDILLVNLKEIYLIYGGFIVVFALIAYNWQRLILLTISNDLAAARGINCFALQLLFIFLMTIAVAISIRIIGVLLITSMMIIPAACAKQLANSPKSMTIIAVLTGVIATICGIVFSYYFDVPAGPAIVFVTTILFIVVFVARNVIPLRN